MATPTVTGTQMSDSLKARLKRCGRSYSSPVPTKRSHTNIAGIHAETADKTPPTLKKHRGTADNQFRMRCLNTHTECSEAVADACGSTAHHSLDTSNIPGAAMPSTNPCRKLTTEFPSKTATKSATIPGDITMDSCERSVMLVDSSRDGTPVKAIQDSSGTTPADRESSANTSVDLNTKESELIKTKMRLQKLVSEKEETLRKLKMVKMYRSKNNLEDLEVLIIKWRSRSQEAVVRLQGLAQEPKPTIGALLDHLQIEHSMLGFSADDDSFT